MNFSPFLSIDNSCDETVKWSKEQLIRIGLHPVQTFDLHTARLAQHNCPCPSHGTDECDCQMVVLLVYGKTDAAATLILHGNGEKTWLSIAGIIVSNSTGSLAELIKDTLLGQEFVKIEVSK